MVIFVILISSDMMLALLKNVIIAMANRNYNVTDFRKKVYI